MKSWTVCHTALYPSLSSSVPVMRLSDVAELLSCCSCCAKDEEDIEARVGPLVQV